MSVFMGRKKFAFPVGPVLFAVCLGASLILAACGRETTGDRKAETFPAEEIKTEMLKTDAIPAEETGTEMGKTVEIPVEEISIPVQPLRSLFIPFISSEHQAQAPDSTLSPNLPLESLAPTATSTAETPPVQITPTVRAQEIPVTDSDLLPADCAGGCTWHVPGCDIKGNISVGKGEKIYHVPGGEFYERTKIDADYGERWFCTEQEALQAGWRKSLR